LKANCVDTIRIEEIYQEILDGKRRNFPQYTWSEDVDRELAKRITRYLIEVVLDWDTEQIINGWTRELLVKYKLGGMLSIAYNGCLNPPLHDAYPDRFKEWQLRVAPNGYWTAENSLDALKWTIEVKEQLKQVYEISWLRKHNLSTPLKVFWNTQPFTMLNDLYPGRFKPWELNKTPNGYWTRENALEALKWTIEVKLKLSDEELKKVYSYEWIKQVGLRTPLVIFWNKNGFKMLNTLYPSRYTRDMFIALQPMT